jgi:hypothetical protein
MEGGILGPVRWGTAPGAGSGWAEAARAGGGAAPHEPSMEGSVIWRSPSRHDRPWQPFSAAPHRILRRSPVRHNRARIGPTQRWAARMWVVLAVMAVTGTMAAPASASVAAPTAQTTSVLTPQDRAGLPAGARKVTRAGLVHGTISAQVGDIVLAATVLHVYELHQVVLGPNGPGGADVHLRYLTAVEENTSNEVRGYWRFRLVYGANDTTWSTYHQGATLRVHRIDGGTNQADGCLAYPNHCTWSKNPSDCLYPSPTCNAYQQTGTYRPKGDAADWWLTEFREYKVWHPNLDKWIFIWTYVCSNYWLQGTWWEVGGAQREPTDCPVAVGV